MLGLIESPSGNPYPVTYFEPDTGIVNTISQHTISKDDMYKISTVYSPVSKKIYVFGFSDYIYTYDSNNGFLATSFKRPFNPIKQYVFYDAKHKGIWTFGGYYYDGYHATYERYYTDDFFFFKPV